MIFTTIEKLRNFETFEDEYYIDKISTLDDLIWINQLDVSIDVEFLAYIPEATPANFVNPNISYLDIDGTSEYICMTNAKQKFCVLHQGYTDDTKLALRDILVNSDKIVRINCFKFDEIIRSIIMSPTIYSLDIKCSSPTELDKIITQLGSTLIPDISVILLGFGDKKLNIDPLLKNRYVEYIATNQKVTYTTSVLRQNNTLLHFSAPRKYIEIDQQINANLC